MVHVQCRKRQEQATYKLKGRTLKTSTFTLASTRVVLGCQSEQEVHFSIFRFIWILPFFPRWIVMYIRLVWFQCKVTILFTVFVSPPPPPPPPPLHTQRATAATKYSMHILPLLPLKKKSEVKQANKMNTASAEPITLKNKHNRTHSEDVSLVHVISGYHGRFPSFVIMSLDSIGYTYDVNCGVLSDQFV